MDELTYLAQLIAERNTIDAKIAQIINRPAEKGHIAEYLASRIFGISLHSNAAHAGSDGAFTGGPLAGRTVNVKYGAKHDGLLDINSASVPDYYLVIVGPKTQPVSSVGSTLPFVIETIYLLDGPAVILDLQQRRIRMGPATSVKSALWTPAEIYPVQRNPVLVLSEEQRSQLARFHAPDSRPEATTPPV